MDGGNGSIPMKGLVFVDIAMDLWVVKTQKSKSIRRRVIKSDKLKMTR